MPRDSAGTFSLVSGNPVQSGEIVSSSWANNTLSDVATALSDSLDRFGRGGMLAPFKFADGSRLAPGASWTNEPTTGFYRFDSGDLRLAVQAVDKLRATNPGNVEVWEPNLNEWVDIFNIGIRKGLSVNLISSDVTAVVGRHYHCLVDNLTVTLPADPGISDQVGVSVGSFPGCVVNSNGKKVAGEVQDVAMDLDNLYLTFQYASDTEGWIVTSQALSSAVTGGLPKAGSTQGATLSWDATEERWQENPVLNVSVDNKVRGIFTGSGVNTVDTRIEVLDAPPATPADDVLYLIKGDGVYLGATLIAEVNP